LTSNGVSVDGTAVPSYHRGLWFNGVTSGLDFTGLWLHHDFTIQLWIWPVHNGPLLAGTNFAYLAFGGLPGVTLNAQSYLNPFKMYEERAWVLVAVSVILDLDSQNSIVRFFSNNESIGGTAMTTPFLETVGSEY
jgi:hypothetical protein